MSNETEAMPQQYLGRNALINAEGLKSLGSDGGFSLGSQGGQRQTIYEVDQRPQSNDRTAAVHGKVQNVTPKL